MSVFFTSDTHFGHESMISKGWRPQFRSLEEMHDTMVQNWNKVVKKDDEVWHLGDWGAGRNPLFELSFLPMLNGTVHLVTGNHDECWPGHRKAHQKQGPWLRAGFASVQAFARRKIGKRQIMLSHFPYEGDHTEGERYNEYRLHDTGMWLLHGHVHDTWVIRNRQINVGVDVWNFTPVRLEVIHEMIREYETETRRYRVGDPDPTPDDDEECCSEYCEPIGVCTWSAGHDGQHVAGDGETIVGVAG